MPGLSFNINNLGTQPLSANKGLEKTSNAAGVFAGAMLNWIPNVFSEVAKSIKNPEISKHFQEIAKNGADLKNRIATATQSKLEKLQDAQKKVKDCSDKLEMQRNMLQSQLTRLETKKTELDQVKGQHAEAQKTLEDLQSGVDKFNEAQKSVSDAEKKLGDTHAAKKLKDAKKNLQSAENNLNTIGGEVKEFMKNSWYVQEQVSRMAPEGLDLKFFSDTFPGLREEANKLGDERYKSACEHWNYRYEYGKKDPQGYPLESDLSSTRLGPCPDSDDHDRMREECFISVLAQNWKTVVDGLPAERCMEMMSKSQQRYEEAKTNDANAKKTSKSHQMTIKESITSIKN